MARRARVAWNVPLDFDVARDVSLDVDVARDVSLDLDVAWDISLEFDVALDGPRSRTRTPSYLKAKSEECRVYLDLHFPFNPLLSLRAVWRLPLGILMGLIR